MTKTIRLGLVGASAKAGGWGAMSHFPALTASKDIEVTAVCTSRPESAAEAQKAFGAKLAFHDYREMVTSPEIDAVAVVLRVPMHHAPTMAALAAGKHVYTEWPLGRTTAEAEEMAATARRMGLQTAVGLQSRVNPPLVYMKELIENGYVGEVLSCHTSCMRDGSLNRPSSRTWSRLAEEGQNSFTVHNGHVVDALRFVVGDFAAIQAMATTQAPQWYETDTKRLVDVTAPDNILIGGPLKRGAIASVRVGAVPWAGSGYRLEVYGREGSLMAISDTSSQRGEMHLFGTQGHHEFSELPIPERFNHVPADFPRGNPFNVGQMYAVFADSIRTGRAIQPTFDTALDLHRFLDVVRHASATGGTVPVG
jgi:predicted dehydrogenase